MPVGIQRLNAKKTQPNPRIIFIKPLKGPDEAIALDFLERIAAQCLPIMKEHTLSVMTLEEYEPNREFVGRNFNAGEVIQLVLKSPSTGRWLPFNYVQMVMMHELAHCKQMNHSRAFWAVRNQYAEQMRTLWSRQYTGEGLWGRGALLSTGQFEANTVRPDEALPEHTCGGTYRSRRRGRGRKRKAQQLSYQEQKERRILKKFGPNGQALGDDEDVKAQLEKGRRTQAKPRVAGSMRGRELRAAAALARFGQQQADSAKEAKKQKEEEQEEGKTIKVEGEDDDETVSGSDSETASDTEQEEGPAAVDINGQSMLDEKGRNLVKVCEDEDADDGDAQNEMRELLQSSIMPVKNSGPDQSKFSPEMLEDPPRGSTSTLSITSSAAGKAMDKNKTRRETSVSASGPQILKKPQNERPKSAKLAATTNSSTAVVKLDPEPTAGDKSTKKPSSLATTPTDHSNGNFNNGNNDNDDLSCSMCSFANEPGATICMICSHVLNPGRVPGAWSCQSATCKASGSSSKYLNAGDSGVCGVCGERRKS